MSDPNSDDKPLDPEAARIVARVRRLTLISGATTLIAVSAVLGVIGYRLFNAEGSGVAPAVPAMATAALPRGAKVMATGVSDGRIAVTIEIDGATEIRTFDLRTLKPTGQLKLTVEP
jgi:hypothetical protein